MGRLARRWIKIHCDTYDFGRAGVAGAVVRPPTDALERHLNAKRWQDRLDTHRLWHLEAHRAGDTTLFVAPKRRAVGRNPAITRCYRIPIGSDPATADAIVERLNQLHRGLLYAEREPDAYYAYATYPLPSRRRGGGSGSGAKVYMGAAATNRAMRGFDAWLGHAFAALGWGRGVVEVLGTFTEAARDPRGKRLVVEGSRAQVFRAPKCPDGDAFLRLRLSRFFPREVPWLWDASARADFSLLPTRAGHTARFEPQTPQVRDCVFESLRYFFGATLPRHPLPPSQLEAVEQRAVEAWERRDDRGVYAFVPQPMARAVVRKFIQRVLRKWLGPAGWENDTLHFGAFAIEEAEALLRSLISQKELRAVNLNPKLRWARVTYRALAVALCTIAKNSLVNNEYVPTKSVKRMLRYWGIGTNGSHVKALMDALRAVGLIRCTKPTYGEGVCRCFAVADVVILHLDFLSAFREDAVRRVAAARVAAAAARRPHAAGPETETGDAPSAQPDACIGLRLRYANVHAHVGTALGVKPGVPKTVPIGQFREEWAAPTWDDCAPAYPTSI